MTTGSFGSSWFQYFLCLFHQKVWSVIFLNHFWDPSGWGLIFSKKPKSRGFFFRSSMGHLLSESCRKMSYAFFTSQLLGRTVRGIKLEDERLKPEMMVWFRWFSFSNGWFLGSKAVNFPEVYSPWFVWKLFWVEGSPVFFKSLKAQLLIVTQNNPASVVSQMLLIVSL